MGSTEFDQHGAWFNTTAAGHEAEFADFDVRNSRLKRVLRGLFTLVSFLVPGAAGAWLCLNGHRTEAVIAICFALAMPLVWICVAFWPSTLIAAPILGRYRNTHPLVVIVLGFLAAGWQYCVIAAWTLGVFLFFSERMYPGVTLPMSALVFGVVLGPLSFMAEKDPGSDSSPLLALAFALLTFATIVVGYLQSVSLVSVIAALVVLAMLMAGLNTFLVGRAALRLRRSGFDPMDVDSTGVGRALHQAINRGSSTETTA